MNKSKVVLLLRTFSVEELRKFRDFLLSPVFNRNKTLLRYYDLLKKYHPEFDEKKMIREKIYAKLFTGKPYNEQVMKNLTSELYKLCKEFLVFEFSRKDNYESKLNLLKQLILRKADSVFYSELKIFESELKEITLLSEKNFYYLYQLEEAKISFHLERNEQPKVFDKVMKSGEYLIFFFLLNLTKTISNLNVNKQSFNVNYDVNLPQEFFDNTSIEKIIDYMRKNNVEFSEIAELYLYRIICNTFPYDENYFFKFKDLVMKNIKTLNRIEVYGLFNALETFCLIKINSGNIDFNNELFDIFNLEMKENFYKYSESSPLTFMKFRNTYLSALTLKKYDWIENFINTYSKELIESDRDNILRIAKAQLEFEKGNFEDVLVSIAEIKPGNIYSKVDIKNLTLMSYYELDHIEASISMIDSYRHFLSSSSNISEVFKENHFRFINSLHTLIINRDKKQKDKLYELKEKLLPFKSDRRIIWLNDKLDKLTDI